MKFKEKLKIYKKMKTKSVGTTKLSNLTTIKIMKPKEEIRCFNCSKLSHKSITCENKNKSTKCFRCNEFDHKLLDYKKEKSKKMKNSPDEDMKKIEAMNSLSTPREIYKTIKIKDEKFNALMDIGSQCNIVNQSLYYKMGALILLKSELHFSRFEICLCV